MDVTSFQGVNTGQFERIKGEFTLESSIMTDFLTVGKSQVFKIPFMKID